MKIQTFVLGGVETNCYVVSDEERNCVIVDCDGDGKTLVDYIKENQLKPQLLLLTHGHFDHTGAVKPLKETYPKLKICISQGDLELLQEPKKSLANLLSENRVMEADIIVKEGDSLQVGAMKFQVLETPGHTKGGVCYLAEDALFSGDTLFAGDCGRVDLYGGDWGEMQASLRKLALLEGNPAVYPGHGPSSRLEEERRHNQYMKQA